MLTLAKKLFKNYFALYILSRVRTKFCLSVSKFFVLSLNNVFLRRNTETVAMLKCWDVRCLFILICVFFPYFWWKWIGSLLHIWHIGMYRYVLYMCLFILNGVGGATWSLTDQYRLALCEKTCKNSAKTFKGKHSWSLGHMQIHLVYWSTRIHMYSYAFI